MAEGAPQAVARRLELPCSLAAREAHRHLGRGKRGRRWRRPDDGALPRRRLLRVPLRGATHDGLARAEGGGTGRSLANASGTAVGTARRDSADNYNPPELQAISAAGPRKRDSKRDSLRSASGTIWQRIAEEAEAIGTDRRSEPSYGSVSERDRFGGWRLAIAARAHPSAQRAPRPGTDPRPPRHRGGLQADEGRRARGSRRAHGATSQAGRARRVRRRADGAPRRSQHAPRRVLSWLPKLFTESGRI